MEKNNSNFFRLMLLFSYAGKVGRAGKAGSAGSAGKTLRAQGE